MRMTQNNRLISADQKRPYKEPKLANLGDFRNLTMGGGGTKQDGGKGSPNTKL